jgi:hypothetical protein
LAAASVTTSLKEAKTSRDRDHHRERDEIWIVSCEHDRLGPSRRHGQASSRRRVYQRSGGKDNRPIAAPAWQNQAAILYLTRFLDTNRYPLRWKTLCADTAPHAATPI